MWPSLMLVKNSSALGHVRVTSGVRAGRRSNQSLPWSIPTVHSKFQSSSTQSVAIRTSRICLRTERSRPVRTNACWINRRAARFEMDGLSDTFKQETIPEGYEECGVLVN